MSQQLATKNYYLKINPIAYMSILKDITLETLSLDMQTCTYCTYVLCYYSIYNYKL
jgi:hypothetical protein